MTPDLGRIDPALIRQAFIDPIRTVMLIDDRFPTLTAAVDAATGSAPAPPNDAGEWQRAGRLWRGCRKRQWICDTEHRSDWSKDDIACIAGSDLIVLDYHLEGEVDTPAVASCMLLRDLAAHSHTNLVVVYTSDPNLDNVRNEIVAGLRGHLDWKAIIRSDDGQLERAFNIFKKAVTAAGAFDEVAFLALCSGDETWCTPLRDPILRVREQYKDEAAVGESWGKDWRDKLYAAFAEHHLEEKGAHLVDQVESVRAGDRWVECGNVFVTLMTKPDDPPDNETETLVQQLEEALIEWKPSGMRAAVALARAEVRRAGLRGEALSLPKPMLEAGWWYSMLTAKDGSDQSDRARQIATDLLAGVSDVVADKVGRFIAGSAPSPIEGNEDAMQRARALAGVTGSDQETNFAIGHAFNAFLSCGRSPPTQVGCGTILAISSPGRNSESYFVSVSPACDMVRRKPNGTYQWLRALHPWRPTVALAVIPVKETDERTDALRDSTISRWLFVEDRDDRLILRLRPNTKTEQLTHETLFISVAGTSVDGKLDVYRVTTSSEGIPTIASVTGRIIAQLRPPFAEHVLALAGQHLSRIGTDYFGVPQRPRDD